MTDRDSVARKIALAKLAQSRGELKALLDPPRNEDGTGAEHSPFSAGAQFPRSKTMQMLMSSRGLGTLVALAGGLLVAKPGLALRLLRLVPASSVAKMLLTKVVSSLRSSRE